jgi:dihydroxyacetone kinase-like predicted kinase
LQILGESIAIAGAAPNFTFHVHCDDPETVLVQSEKLAAISDFRITELGS